MCSSDKCVFHWNTFCLDLFLTLIVLAGSNSRIPQRTRPRAPSVVFRKTRMWNSSWLRNSIFTHPGVVDDYEYDDEVEFATATPPPAAAEDSEEDDEDDEDEDEEEDFEEDEILKQELAQLRDEEAAKILSTVTPSAFFRALLNDCCTPVETATCRQKLRKPGSVKRVSEVPGPWPVGRRGSKTWREKRVPEVGPGAAGRRRRVRVWTRVGSRE